MTSELLSAKQAANKLGISVTSLYAWLAQSDSGQFKLRGVPFTIDYFQGGANGQGRIQIESTEIERILDAMRVQPQATPKRRAPVVAKRFPGIHVTLGRPDQVVV